MHSEGIVARWGNILADSFLGRERKGNYLLTLGTLPSASLKKEKSLMLYFKFNHFLCGTLIASVCLHVYFRREFIPAFSEAGLLSQRPLPAFHSCWFSGARSLETAREISARLEWTDSVLAEQAFPEYRAQDGTPPSVTPATLLSRGSQAREFWLREMAPGTGRRCGAPAGGNPPSSGRPSDLSGRLPLGDGREERMPKAGAHCPACFTA